MLPQEFKERMKNLLGEEYETFFCSYERAQYQALRLNPLKADTDTFLTQTKDWELRRIPWTQTGYYLPDGNDDKSIRPGKHPYHEAGVYYIQEPSAMAPAEYIDAKPGEKILDLCAAPGGKSTQIAGKMAGEGLLLCNEIHPARAKILSENIERMGIRNAIVTNETPQHLSEVFVEYFDKIMVDAPCSGEGMFRKNEAACEEWSIENVLLCAKRQDEILDCAAGMLRPGGRIVYSTCTFAPEENEGSISRFLSRYPEFEILHVEKAEGMSDGKSEWIENAAEKIEDTIRLFPHKLKGEGHYVAVLQKKADGSGREYAKGGEEKSVSKDAYKAYLAFAAENLKEIPKGVYVTFGEQLYLAPEQTPKLKGLKVLRPGLHLGTNKKNRFEPSHALALALSPQMVEHNLNLPVYGCENETDASTAIRAYLNGQTIPAEGEKGWYLITVDGYSIGWGKLVGGMMKNHYPKGLRKNLSAYPKCLPTTAINSCKSSPTHLS
ncbi:MAG: RsmB/NOP family class I SAM-dependent RNA methyltransferase [Lachnospiraceae bacterium]|nr:RsmB/NOP family class I SAM-dependent RNA methyltransferase [Lachnospiraceae bacterium]